MDGPPQRHSGLMAIAVAALHIAVLASLMQLHPAQVVERIELPALEGEMLAAQSTENREPIPEVKIRNVKFDASALRNLRFEAPEWGDISEISAASSTPQLSRFQPVGIAEFARRAGLKPGESITVLLMIEAYPMGAWAPLQSFAGRGTPASIR